MSKDISATIAKNLTYFLEKRGFTQADLARKLNVSTATACNWCKGIKMPRMDKIDIICEFLSIERSDLMEEKEPQADIFSLETLLASAMSELNEEGREKVLEYAKYLVFTGEYKKQDFRQVVVQEVC